MPRVTLEYVATAAKVSPITVSRVFSGKSYVAKETYDKVKKIANEMGYRTNLLARGLAGGSTSTIGLVWSVIGPHPTQRLTEDVALSIQNKGYYCTIANGLGKPDLTCKILSDMHSRKVDAVIVQLNDALLSNSDILKLLVDFRSVLTVSAKPINLPFDNIFHNRDIAFEHIARHLVKKGRKRSAFIGTMPANQTKFNAFKKGLIATGVSAEKSVDLVEIKSLGSTKGNDFVKAFDNKVKTCGFDYDAVICTCDEGAAGLMSYFELTGKKVPKDVAVIGANDSEMCPYLRPKLASIARNDDILARKIEEMVFKRIENPEMDVQQKNVDMEFVWRESAG